LKPVDPTLVVIGFVLACFAFKGILVRFGTWSGSEWIRFVLQLALSAGLIKVALVMAGEVDKGLTHGWPPATRLAYVITMMLMLLYGALSSVWLIKAFAGDDSSPQMYSAMLITFIVLTLALGAAAWLSEVAAISFQQSGAVVLGLFCLLLGTHTPNWVRLSYRYRLVADIVGETGTRVFYGAVGLTLIGFGVLGRAHIFR
jgi:hypothetical protein